MCEEIQRSRQGEAAALVFGGESSGRHRTYSSIKRGDDSIFVCEQQQLLFGVHGGEQILVRLITVLTQLYELKLCDIVAFGQSGPKLTGEVGKAYGLTLLLEDPAKLMVEALRKDTIAKERKLANFGSYLHAVVDKTGNIVPRIFFHEVLVEDVGDLTAELVRS